MAYVTSSGSPPGPSGGCIFCDALASSDDRKNLILRRSPKAFLILNKYPYASGHVMVSLNRHVGSLEETLTVYRFSPDGYVEILAAQRGERVRAEPFESIELPVGVFFGEEFAE